MTLISTLELNFEPVQHVIYEGITSGVPISKLEQRESCEVEMPIAFVSSGRFDLIAQVRRLGEPTIWVGRGQLSAMVGTFA